MLQTSPPTIQLGYWTVELLTMSLRTRATYLFMHLILASMTL
ncbi:hypothetical protein Pint_35965 [Pistacia integerrima]|uniref:Uncharacterized protein n=1 Tax=Pistacia integerrima TaxID=434235 RepID=A0ACC0Y381_9ROSI|nr:hypothetical protein Pint_35965 [Pistacia integerrima]